MFISSVFEFVDEVYFHLVEIVLSELVLRYLFVSPFMIAFLVAFGWYDSACTYSCLLVGLIIYVF